MGKERTACIWRLIVVILENVRWQDMRVCWELKQHEVEVRKNTSIRTVLSLGRRLCLSKLSNAKRR